MVSWPELMDIVADNSLTMDIDSKFTYKEVSKVFELQTRYSNINSDFYLKPRISIVDLASSAVASSGRNQGRNISPGNLEH